MVMIPKRAPAANTSAATDATVKPASKAPAAAAENTAGPAAVAEAAAPAAAAAPASEPVAATTAVATPRNTAVAVAGRPVDVIKQNFQDAFKVDWNTLNRIQATNGNFVDVEEGKRVIAPEIVLEVMSYQDNWQYSPGTDDDTDIQYVRYSDDGVTCTDGTNMNEHMEAMRVAGYTEGKLAQRVVIAGTIVGGTHDGKLVQLNLAPTSKAMFDRFRMQVSIDIAKGKRAPEDVQTLKLRAVPESKGKNTWTKVVFDYAK